MPFAVTQITATGSSDPLSFSFPYRSTSDIVVKVDGVTKTATTHYTFPTTSSVQFTSGNVPTSGQVVEIRRATSQNTRLVDYVSGAILTESDLDTDSNQAFFMAQESIDIANDGLTLQSTGVFDGSSKRITNVADPTGAQDAATKAYTDSQFATVAPNAAAAATSASAAATSATNSAASATSAASSATSATTDGAAQVTLATAQVALATTQATNAAASATAAAASAASASVTIASQAEAEAGTNNANVMTALRTKQAVDSYGVVTADDVGTSGANKILKLDGSGDLPALSGANLTSLNASNLGSGTVATARLGTGTASGSVFLAGDGSWKAAGGGSLVHITTVTASNSASIDIASTLTDTYNSYFVTFANLVPAVNNTEFVMLFSTDNGSSFVTGSAYVYNVKHFYIGPSGDGNSESTGDSSIRLALSVSSTAADGGLSGYMHIHSPTNSAVKTHVNFSAIQKYGDGSNTAASLLGGGYVGAATDDDAFQIKNESGNIASGTVRVYGIANS